LTGPTAHGTKCFWTATHHAVRRCNCPFKRWFV
jgi:hypothetical protein